MIFMNVQALIAVVLHLVGSILFVMLAIVIFKKMKMLDEKVIPFKWSIVIGFLITGLFVFDFTVKRQYSIWINQAIMKEQAEQQNVNQKTDLNRAKREFLSAVEFLVSNPDQLNPKSKKSLFDQYAVLFPSGLKDVEIFKNQIAQAMSCQLSLYEDAVKTSSGKSKYVSDKTKKCMEMSGEFFNRAKLLAPEMIQSHEALLANIISPKSKDQTVEAKDLNLLVEGQNKKISVLDKVFE